MMRYGLLNLTVGIYGLLAMVGGIISLHRYATDPGWEHGAIATAALMALGGICVGVAIAIPMSRKRAVKRVSIDDCPF